ncbi:hypothetical protein PV10_01369 [Exophiala mesophila]|uniref:PI-PLC Y-box domain-containing protein n=1 Tax=Exophiala mesophila TaxID=212818 RepID=A0A0D1X731_EXOME|nr:uncharacterized protein PV10_01369 [Exophiala mesophila]KIV97650.1 hypothetical protein PV10_01369 [Exophiala mesophila]
MRTDLALDPHRKPTRKARPDKIDSLKSHNVATGNLASISVQDRIRQWQAQGAANALDPDTISLCSATPSASAHVEPVARNERTGRSATRSREDTGYTASASEARSTSAPRKRIVSDDHWKAKQKAKVSRFSSSRSKLKSYPRNWDPTYASSSIVNARDNKDTMSNPYLSSVMPGEVDIGSPPDLHTSLEPDIHHQHDGQWSNHDGESNSDLDLARRLASASFYSDDFDVKSDTSIQPEDFNGTPQRPSKYVETLAKLSPAPQPDLLPRPKRGTLFGKTKEILIKSEEPQVNNRLPSIEAWLDEQPDPFVDSHIQGDLPPVDIPQPLKKRHERRRSSKDPSPTVDPNKIWDSVQNPTDVEGPSLDQTRSRPSRRRTPSSSGTCTPKQTDIGPSHLADASPSPSSLRRRGARLRRSKEVSMSDAAQLSKIYNQLPDLLEENMSQAKQPLDDPARLLSLTEYHPVSSTPPEPLPNQNGNLEGSNGGQTETLPNQNGNLEGSNGGQTETHQLKRRLTTHEDLMSVLSMPTKGRSIRSARSIRHSHRSKASHTAQEVLASLLADEEKYSRELRTLVDGVIPVLLQTILSKTDAAAAAGLFTTSQSAESDGSFTKPIIEMGIALERLKSLHGRIPFENVDNLLRWAQTAQKAYNDYLLAWRLGFQDVVVNLAPWGNSPSTENGMTHDETGDVIDVQGKKVDVAYLLKRPLVRVKGLGKTFANIRDECRTPLATQVATTYADLTAMAKRRFQEEQARLEDEAAAYIDATRARDVRTLAPITGVVVNKERRVKARDFFNLTIYHKSGQRLDCGIELIYRDNARGKPEGGDVLICEVDNCGKWLLFPPVDWSSISARRGEGGIDLVIMIRGRAGLGEEWHELLALNTDDPEAVTEWMNMLGSSPLPPRLNRTSSFVKKTQSLTTSALQAHEAVQVLEEEVDIDKSIDFDTPLGEPSVIGKRTEVSRRSLPPESTRPGRLLQGLNLGGALAVKPLAVGSTQVLGSSVLSGRSNNVPTSQIGRSSSPSSPRSVPRKPAPQSPVRNAPSSTIPSFKPISPYSVPLVKSTSVEDQTKLNKVEISPKEQWTPSTPGRSSEPKPVASESKSTSGPEQLKVEASQEMTLPKAERPSYNRTLSSTPSRELPTVAKLRPNSSTTNLVGNSPPLSVTQPPTVSPQQSSKQERAGRRASRRQPETEEVPQPPPHSSAQQHKSRADNGPNWEVIGTPADDKALDEKSINKLALGPKVAPSTPDKPPRRRTSSPLKHEYAPSPSSDSSSNYDSDSGSESSSETSDDMTLERGDVPTPLVSIKGVDHRSLKHSRPPPPSSSTGTRTIAPSDSASQGPYRKAPPSSTLSSGQRHKAIALICSWSDRGVWEQIHPDECSIVVSPGLIEAFEMSAAHSEPQTKAAKGNSDDSQSKSFSIAQQPLVAFELTPIVPLRRGTALDISIRSPPTSNSKILTTNNVMFRSRNPEECEALYGMINWARCNNLTYIQLQMARPKRQPSVSFNVKQAGHARSRSSSWFSFGNARKNSYRASSAPTMASMDQSVDSSGTMTNAFSALKRFRANSGFNLNRSSVVRRSAGSAGPRSIYSSSSGTNSGSGSSTPVPSQIGFVPGKDGPNVPSTSAAAANGGGMINMMKIRLYVRKGQQWENLGAARLTVLPAPGQPQESRNVTPHRGGTVVDPSPPVTPQHGRSPSSVMTAGLPGQNRGPRLPSSSNTPHRVHGNGREKRILIVKNKQKDTVLLDTVLGESCFEKIMQTGIAVKVWIEDDTIAHTGGVTLGKEKVYMMQFPTTKEAGWVFGLCGTYRYGSATT